MDQTGWNHPDTPRYYEAFCRRYARYRTANRSLIGHASVGGCRKILDFAAGTGRTAEATLKFLEPEALLLCVEPADAMRAAGIERVRDPRVSWAAELPRETCSWDRILCGAAIWQLDCLQNYFRLFALLLNPTGALCFNIPSLYLGEADEPGGGEDPRLLKLPSLLNDKRTSAPQAAGVTIPTAAQITAMLREAGFDPQRWGMRTRLGYAAYRDWLKIPINTESLFAGTPADDRAALIDEAFKRVDRRSWRWERWTGWTAWRSIAADESHCLGFPGRLVGRGSRKRDSRRRTRVNAPRLRPMDSAIL
jgi:SAM-dependent methyltransferase